MKTKRSRGITIIGILLIAGSIYKLMGLLDYGYYQWMFQHYSEGAIRFRYIISFSLRIIGLITGIGLLCLQDNFRKTAIVLAVLNLCVLYWKYPIRVFQNIALEHEQQILPLSHQNQQVQDLIYPFFPWISMIFYFSIDILFYLGMIFFLTRPTVIAQFKKIMTL